jgi:hypothetical protein
MTFTQHEQSFHDNSERLAACINEILQCNGRATSACIICGAR